MRYEKHRVWEVEGNLKDNFICLFTPVFYIDEDTKGIVATEIYGRELLWRAELGGGVRTELPLCGNSGDTVYDLMVGRYLMLGLINEEKPIDSTPNISTPIVTRRRIFAVSVDKMRSRVLSPWAMSF